MKVEQQVPLLWEKCPALNDALMWPLSFRYYTIDPTVSFRMLFGVDSWRWSLVCTNICSFRINDSDSLQESSPTVIGAPTWVTQLFDAAGSTYFASSIEEYVELLASRALRGARLVRPAWLQYKNPYCHIHVRFSLPVASSDENHNKLLCKHVNNRPWLPPSEPREVMYNLTGWHHVQSYQLASCTILPAGII